MKQYPFLNMVQSGQVVLTVILAVSSAAAEFSEYNTFSDVENIIYYKSTSGDHVWALIENKSCGGCGTLNIGQQGAESVGPLGQNIEDGFSPVDADVMVTDGRVVLAGDKTDAWTVGDVFVIRETSSSSQNLLGPLTVSSMEVTEHQYGIQTFLSWPAPQSQNTYLQGKWIYKKANVPQQLEQNSSTDATASIPPKVCQDTCDKSTSCAGFVYAKNQKRCYFKRSTSCQRSHDTSKDCWTKVKNPNAAHKNTNEAKQECKKGVCAGSVFYIAQKATSIAKCADSCFNSNLNGHSCEYYAYSNVTDYCIHYKSCPRVDVTELKLPKDSYLEAGDPSSYSTCKFTEYMTETWLDMKGLTTRMISESHGGKASRAIDGNMRNDWGGGSCVHTHRHDHPWWEVDFKEDTQVDAVRVLNRGDCCEQRLAKFDVKVDGVLCGDGKAPNRGQMEEVQCGVKGKTLQIEVTLREHLNFCEVQVKQYHKVDVSNETWFL